MLQHGRLAETIHEAPAVRRGLRRPRAPKPRWGGERYAVSKQAHASKPWLVAPRCAALCRAAPRSPPRRQVTVIKLCRSRYESTEPLVIGGFGVTREVVEPLLLAQPEVGRVAARGVTFVGHNFYSRISNYLKGQSTQVCA